MGHKIFIISAQCTSLFLNGSSDCNFLLSLKTCLLLSLTIPTTVTHRQSEVQILPQFECINTFVSGSLLVMKQNCATSISSSEEMFIHGHESLGTSLNWNNSPQAGLIAISQSFIMNCRTRNSSYLFSSYKVPCMMSVHNGGRLIRGS